MAVKGSDFFKQQQQHPCAPGGPPPEPELPACSDCDLPANPSWGDVGGKVYCKRCVPASLRNPSQYLRNEDDHAA